MAQAGRKKGKWKKAPFGCDGAGNPILPTTGNVQSPAADDKLPAGKVVQNTAETQKRLNQIIGNAKKAGDIQ